MTKNNALIVETNILLDIGGTVVNIKEPFEVYTKRAIGYVYDFIQPGGDRDKFIERAYQQRLKIREKARETYEEIPFKIFARKACGKLPFEDVIYDTLETEYIRAEIEVSELFDDTLDFLKKAKAAGKDIYAASNNFSVKHVHELLKHLKIEQYFKGIYVSGECGFRKPRPGFIVSLCWEYNLHIKDCVIIGDTPEMDIRAGKNALIKTVLLDRAGQYEDLTDDLKPDSRISSLDDVIMN